MTNSVDLQNRTLTLDLVLVRSTDVDYTQAACAGENPEWWFPYPSQDPAAAVAICAGCPIRRECRAFAEKEGLTGVWGGANLDRGQEVKRA